MLLFYVTFYPSLLWGRVAVFEFGAQVRRGRRSRGGTVRADVTPPRLEGVGTRGTALRGGEEGPGLRKSIGGGWLRDTAGARGGRLASSSGPSRKVAGAICSEPGGLVDLRKWGRAGQAGGVEGGGANFSKL